MLYFDDRLKKGPNIFPFVNDVDYYIWNMNNSLVIIMIRWYDIIMNYEALSYFKKVILLEVTVKMSPKKRLWSSSRHISRSRGVCVCYSVTQQEKAFPSLSLLLLLFGCNSSSSSSSWQFGVRWVLEWRRRWWWLGGGGSGSVLFPYGGHWGWGCRREGGEEGCWKSRQRP